MVKGKTVLIRKKKTVLQLQLCEWGHFASECWHAKGKQTSEQKTNVARDDDSDEDPVLLGVIDFPIQKFGILILVATTI